jgi:hypothetical protein
MAAILFSDHVDLFKNHLDVFLSSIPDQPKVTGLGRAAESNSLLHQLYLLYVLKFTNKELIIKN